MRVITKRVDNQCQIWLEDFCIIGCGETTDAAVTDAVRNCLRIGTIVQNEVCAITEVEKDYGE